MTNRRELLRLAAALGASAAWARLQAKRPSFTVRERRDLYPEGVASGDPDSHSVLLWTRRPYAYGRGRRLRVEVSDREAFTEVVATTSVRVSEASDWTCRVLVGNLEPARVYWYRFVDEDGNASRVGRTLTAPADSDPRPVKFAFVSCQNINLGVQHAYRRMIFEDERATAAEQLGFVLHLGDFIYETVWYPEDGAPGTRGRAVRDAVRLPDGEKVGAVHVPTTLQDYRELYRAYLHDPDLQDARARWPFVCMWDNHEFSQSGWQSLQQFAGENRPAQALKVIANQAWFEYIPARIVKSSGSSLESFDAPAVRNTPIERFDAHGFGDEPNNRMAIASLRAYRALRWGRHVDLMVTDVRTYRSECPQGRPEARAFMNADFPEMFPQDILRILDAGREYADGRPPATLPFGGRHIQNFRKDAPAQTLLGAEQKSWFLQRLTDSQATWKIWGSPMGTLEYRVDPENLPPGLTTPWPGTGFATHPLRDHSSAYVERAQIYAHVREQNIAGFVTVCGDRHSFWAGLASASLPPLPFEPVGVAFVTGSISTPGLAESLQMRLPKDHPLRALYLGPQSLEGKTEPVVNLLLHHGARSAYEYQRTGDVEFARRFSNPMLSPHLSFLDFAGHGFATVRASADALECEFVAIPPPVERSAARDGGPLLYRVMHRVPLWPAGEKPILEQHVLEGDPALSI